MKGKYKVVEQCRSCKSNQLTDIMSLGNQYLSEFSDDGQKPEQYPLELQLCGNCTLLQLKHTVPASSLYTENYGYKSGVNGTIRSDLKEISQKATEQVSLSPGDVVLDIGANDGTLLSNYPKEIYRVAFEPIKKLTQECQEHADLVVNDFFNHKAWQEKMGDKKAKIITVISCFYDLDDPNTFVEGLTKILDERGVLVIQQNYLGGMLAQNAFDNICHEHLEYYSLRSLEHLLNRHGLEVFDVEQNDINGGSFRTYVRHMSRVDKMRLAERKLKLENEFTYMLFGMKVKHLGKKLHDFVVGEVEAGKKIYLYGASTRVQTLLQYCGLDSSLITAAVERNPEKFGKKIASVGIPIISEEQARAEKPDYFLVGPWFFKKEFLEREKEYLADGGHFIFALPELEVV